MIGTMFALMLVGVGFGALLLVAGRQLSGRLDTLPARRPFESGPEPQVHAWSRFHVRWLNYALLFLLMELWIAFMYPWALAARAAGWQALTALGIFAAVLLLVLAYAWRERALEWD